MSNWKAVVGFSEEMEIPVHDFDGWVSADDTFVFLKEPYPRHRFKANFLFGYFFILYTLGRRFDMICFLEELMKIGKYSNKIGVNIKGIIRSIRELRPQEIEHDEIQHTEE